MRNYFKAAFRVVNEANLKDRARRGDIPVLVGMPRKERWDLARAYAAGRWREREHSNGR